jgi:hypothetical protein
MSTCSGMAVVCAYVLYKLRAQWLQISLCEKLAFSAFGRRRNSVRLMYSCVCYLTTFSVSGQCTVDDRITNEYGKVAEMRIGKGNRNTRRKPDPLSDLCTTNPKLPDVRPNPGRRRCFHGNFLNLSLFQRVKKLLSLRADYTVGATAACGGRS